MTETLIRHKIFHALRQEILSCGIRPGEEVRESELAQRFGVSKSPIRDALQKLEFEGLIEIVPRRGHRVAPISISDAEDMLDLREILEAGALRHIAARASDEALRELDGFRTANTDDLAEFAEYNRIFHLSLCELSGNSRLAQTMAGLMENYDRLCVVSLTSLRDAIGGMDDAVVDHNLIIDALQARNAPAAVRVSARHIKKSRTQIMRGLESRPIVA